MTFGHWAQQYLAYKSELVSFSRSQNICGYIKNHMTSLLKKEISSISVSDVRNIITAQSDRYYIATVKDQLGVIRSIFDFAAENGDNCKNVARYVRAIGKPAQTRDALMPDEIRAFDHSTGAIKLPSLIMLYTGLRCGEMLALEWSDIDFDYHILSVSKAVEYRNSKPYLKNATKTKAGMRRVPIPDKLLALLTEQQGKGLICGYRGHYYNKATWQKYWRLYERSLHLSRHITPHYLRHTYCTTLYRSGVDVQVAQRLMGHARCSTTMDVYTHLSQEDVLARSVDKLNDYISGMLT